MRVQKVIVEDKDYPFYILIDSTYEIVEPVLRFMKYLDNTGKSPNTLKTYCYHLKLFYEYLGQKNTTLDKVNLESLAEFVGWLRSPTGEIKVVNLMLQKAKREESTVNSIVVATLSFLDFLNRSGDLPAIDAFKDIKGRNFKGFLHHINKGKGYKKSILKLRVKKKKLKILEYTEVQDIVNACNSSRDKLLLIMMFEGGLRVGEVLSLRVEDVITWDNEIHITPREENMNGAYIKSRRERVIHVSKELMALYTDYLINEYPEELDHDYIFVNLQGPNKGKPLKYQSVLDLVRRLRKKTGIKFNGHMLRHTHATQLIRDGWDAAYVQKRLGHAQVQTTLNTYVHLSDQDLKSEFQKYQQERDRKK